MLTFDLYGRLKKKKLSVPDMTVPDVTKIPPKINAHIHAIMYGISKTSLK